ncbi:hypothetical protein NDU88_002898 [Pleurodeles waltl]|uniref:Secreted protein n=1 Tax=Pleurodeles waltl TaxID=8319 RepID=A0AAV7TME4_PLEWA|nr:hypothetical protein NDU88_002898 [Pleurodeles waltl]
MSRVCAWILLLVFRQRVVPRGCASKFRSHGRRRVDFSLEVGRRCPCEAVRRSSGRPEGVASISVGVRRFSHRGTSCASKISAHEASKCKREVFLVLRLQGTGGKLYPSPWRALVQPDKSSARQQANSKAAVLRRKADR